MTKIYGILGIGILSIVLLASCKKESKDTTQIAFCNCDSSYFRYADSNSSFYLPNAFTPNADGRNDIFRMRFGDYQNFNDTNFIVPGSYLLTVVYGNDAIFFQTNDPLADWDGQDVGGVDADSGTYYYSLKFKLINGVDVDTCGCINLVKNSGPGCIFYKPAYVFEDQINPFSLLPEYFSGENFCH